MTHSHSQSLDIFTHSACPSNIRTTGLKWFDVVFPVLFGTDWCHIDADCPNIPKFPRLWRITQLHLQHFINHKELSVAVWNEPGQCDRRCCISVHWSSASFTAVWYTMIILFLLHLWIMSIFVVDWLLSSLFLLYGRLFDLPILSRLFYCPALDWHRLCYRSFVESILTSFFIAWYSPLSVVHKNELN